MKPKMLLISVLVVSTLLSAVGQLLFKYSFKIPAMFVTLLAAGILIYIVSTSLYLFALAKSHLSWAYSLSGLTNIFTVILAIVFLKEHVSLMLWVGVFLIVAGTVLVGSS